MRRLVSTAIAALVAAGCVAEPAPGDAIALDCEVPAIGPGASTLAGCAVDGLADGGRADARFTNPVGVVRGGDRLLYLVDRGNSAIRVVDDQGAARTLIRRIGFEAPYAITRGADDLLYASTDVDDEGERGPTRGMIWRIDPAGGEPLVIAGELGRPRGLVGLPDGRIGLADPARDAIELLDPRTGEVAPLARVPGPRGLALLPDGRIAVACADHRIRAVRPDGEVALLAGSGAPGFADGPAGHARFDTPHALAVDAGGALYIGDLGNHVVRRLAGGLVTTIAGSGEAGWADSPDPRAAALFGLEGLDVSADGARLWIADGDRGEGLPYHRVRVVELAR